MERRAEHDLPLDGLRILLVDDEFLIAVTLEDTLRDDGADTVIASTLMTAVKSAANDTLSAAILDFRLGRGTTEEVADTLAARDIPFVFYTGQALPADVQKKYPGFKVLAKPANQRTLLAELLKIVGRA